MANAFNGNDGKSGFDSELEHNDSNSEQNHRASGPRSSKLPTWIEGRKKPTIIDPQSKKKRKTDGDVLLPSQKSNGTSNLNQSTNPSTDSVERAQQQAVKILSCPKCSKKCTNRGNLTQHINSHTGIMQTCEYCGFKSDIRSHFIRGRTNFHNCKEGNAAYEAAKHKQQEDKDKQKEEPEKIELRKKLGDIIKHKNWSLNALKNAVAKNEERLKKKKELKEERLKMKLKKQEDKDKQKEETLKKKKELKEETAKKKEQKAKETAKMKLKKQEQKKEQKAKAIQEQKD